jgi:protocatechuate 3,4-dioxygenase beta subunit
MRVLDAGDRPVPSALIEVWQANGYGRYRHPDDRSSRPLDPHFDGFARVRTDDDGLVRLLTVKPGAHPVREGGSVLRAPHLRLTIFASGIDRLVTQMFFEGELLNATDPLLNGIADDDVRTRLIAKAQPATVEHEPREYRLDIVLRGERETPFFDDWDQ